MKFSLKICLFFLFALLVLSAAFCVIFNLSFTNDQAFALADGITLLFPDENSYTQSQNPTLLAVNDKYLAIYDEVDHVIRVKTATTTLNIDASAYSPISKMLLIDNSLAFKYRANSVDTYKYYDLTSSTLAAQVLPLPISASNKYVSDGNKLFERTFDGRLKTYDGNFAQIGGEVTINSLKGNVPFAALDDKAVSFYLNGEYKVELDVATVSTQNIYLSVLQSSNTIPSDVYVTNDFIVASFQNESLSVYNVSTASLLFSAPLSTDCLSVYNNKLYALEHGKRAISVFSVNAAHTALVKEREISFSGNDQSHLNGATDVCDNGNSIYVADSQNDRVVELSKANGSIVSTLSYTTPIAIASSADGLFVATINKVALFKNGTVANEYTLPQGYTAKSIAYLDTLYLLANNATGTQIFSLFAGAFEEFVNADGLTTIATAPNGRFVYTLKSDVAHSYVHAYTKDGILSPSNLTIDKSGATDLCMDACGNAYVSFADGTVQKYARNLYSYTISNEIAPSCPYLDFSLVAFTLSTQGKAYAIASENFVANFYLSSQTSCVATATPTLDGSVVPSPHTVFNADELFFDDFACAEGCSMISKDEVVEVFDTLSASPDCYYVLHNGKFGYMLKTALRAVQTATPTDTSLITITDSAKLYRYPLAITDTPCTTVAQNTALTLIDGVDGFDTDKWYKVSHNGTTYFVERSNVKPFGTDTTVESPTRAKAQAQRIGGTINLYLYPSADSVVVTKVSDGQALELFDEIDGYYYVKYGDVSGYVLVSDVKIGGLTSAQIVGIVLAVLTLFAGTAVWLVTYYTRKKQSQN